MRSQLPLPLPKGRGFLVGQDKIIMEKEKTNFIFVTHDDLDGAACGVLATIYHKIFDKNLKVEYHNYNTAEKRLLMLAEENKNFFAFADISLSSKNILAKLEKSNYFVFGIDHHMTSNFIEFNNYWFTDTKCAANIFYDIYINTLDFWLKSNFNGQQKDTINCFVDNINAWDLWKTDKVEFKYGEQLNLLLDLLGINEFVNKFANNCCEIESWMLNVINYLESKQEKLVKQISNNISILEINKYNIGLIVTDQNHSMLGEYCRKIYKNCDFFAFIDFKEQKVALRIGKNRKLNLGKIAKKLGGGGHKHTAGFPVLNLNPSCVTNIVTSFNNIFKLR